MNKETPGIIKSLGSNHIPYGWLACNGTTVAIAQYPALSAWIGTLFNTGLEPPGFFRLPNSQRKIAVGSGGTGTVILGNATGNTGGEETHTLTKPEMPVHNHGITDSGHAHSSNAQFTAGGGGDLDTGFSSQGAQPSSINRTVTGITLQNEGGSGSHNNVQPTLVVTEIIKW